MKILLIATLRSGGYNLGEWISKELGLKYVHEPLREYKVEDNVVVKHLINNVIEHHSDKEYDDIDTKSYDKVITLHREDVRKASESMSHAQQTDSFHSPYVMSEEWVIKNEEDIQRKEVFIGRCNADISKINYADIGVTYEGIYERGDDIKKLKELLGISDSKYESMLDNNRRLRRNLI